MTELPPQNIAPSAKTPEQVYEEILLDPEYVDPKYCRKARYDSLWKWEHMTPDHRRIKSMIIMWQAELVPTLFPNPGDIETEYTKSLLWHDLSLSTYGYEFNINKVTTPALDTFLEMLEETRVRVDSVLASHEEHKLRKIESILKHQEEQIRAVVKKMEYEDSSPV